MLAILYIIGIVMGLIQKKSRVVRVYQLVITWILFVFNTSNADMSTYRLIYQGYYGKGYEIGFDWWREIISTAGSSFETFWIVTMTIVIVILYRGSRKIYGSISNGALSLMMIFPLIQMVITLRNTMADAIVLYALAWYLRCDTERIINKVKFVIVILIAASFHYSSLFFLIFLVIKEELPLNKSLGKAFLVMAVAVIGLNTSISGYVLNRITHSEKVLSWFYDSNRIGLGFLLVVGLHLLEFAIVIYTNKCHLRKISEYDEIELSIEKKIFSLNVFSMFLIGFYTFNMLFFSRVFGLIILVNTINMFHLMDRYKHNKYVIYGTIMQVGYILLLFFVLYNGDNFLVISDIFKNNSLIQPGKFTFI